MTEKEAQMIASVLRADGKPDDGKKLMDMFFKFISAASMALIFWIFGSVNTLKEDNGNIKKDLQYLTQKVESINDFTQQPRFTKDDYNTQITPLLNQVNKNTAELNSRGQFMEDTQSRLIKLEYKMEEVQRKR